MSTYKQLLRRPEWQARRAEIIELARHECQECGARDCPFEVHHRYYLRGKLPWDYPDAALMCCCRECHEQLGLLDDALRRAIGGLNSLQIEQVLAYAKRLISQCEEATEDLGSDVWEARFL